MAGPLALLRGLPALHVDARRRVADLTPPAAKALRRTAASLRGKPWSEVLDLRLSARGRRSVDGLDVLWTRLPKKAGWLVLLLDDRRAGMSRDLRALCHDLNAPISSAAGYADLLRKALQDVESARRLDRLRSLIDYARAMIRHLAGLRGDPAPAQRIAMKPLLDRVIRQSELEIHEAGAAVEVDATLPDVQGDEMRLQRVFQNLLGNALKFRGEEPLRVRIGFEAGAFLVRDNGKGISKAAQKRIWNPLGGAPGSGLGLSIVKAMVEEGGGRVRLESRPGRGTSFYVQLPLSRHNCGAATTHS